MGGPRRGVSVAAERNPRRNACPGQAGGPVWARRGAVDPQAHDSRSLDVWGGRPQRADGALRRATRGVEAGPRLQLGRPPDRAHALRAADGPPVEPEPVTRIRSGLLPGARRLAPRPRLVLLVRSAPEWPGSRTRSTDCAASSTRIVRS